MSVVLLDTNVLIALLWPAHEAHALCEAWFRAHLPGGWATCPMTEAGFVRIVSNPAFSRDAPRADQALAHLQQNLGHSRHEFWPDSIPLAEAAQWVRGRLFGHRQVTDAYLLGLAIKHRGQLATLDRGIRNLLPAGAAHDQYLVQLG